MGRDESKKTLGTKKRHSLSLTFSCAKGFYTLIPTHPYFAKANVEKGGDG
jgi:hypothetical protein